jgi:hypothetical protein
MTKQSIALVPKSTAVTLPDWPSQRRVQAVADRLDRAGKYLARLKATESALESFHGTAPENRLVEAENALAEYDKREWKAEIEKLETDWNALGPDEWMDEDGNIQQPAVSILLAQLVGSFPTSNIPDAKVFTGMLLDDVMALEPDYYELECACRKIRTKNKFLPSISEVVDAVAEEKAAWNKRYDSLWGIDVWHESLTETLAEKKKLAAEEQERRRAWVEQQAKEKVKRERLAKEEEERRAALAKFNVGDRVWHERYYEGTVLEINETDPGWHTMTVDFESVGCKRIAKSHLRKLLDESDLEAERARQRAARTDFG